MAVEPIPCTPGGGDGPEPGPSCCAPSITTAPPLCREDGSAVLLVLRSACACDGEPPAPPEIAGWIDSATGAFTEGPAPADARPCGTTENGCASVALLRLCDQTDDGACTPFLRRLVIDCDGETTASTDTALDGVTPYEAAGTVIDCDECAPCRPAPMCPQLLGLSGPETWTMPDGTESLAVTVACGPITVADCAGTATVINERGPTFSWAAAASSCAPGSLCGPVTVEVPDGSAVYVQWLSPCAGADES